MLSTLESQVATLFADAVLYGLYLATLMPCLWRLLYGQNGWKMNHHVDWLMLVMSVAIFLSTTLDTALSVRRAMINLRQVLGGPIPDLVWSDTTMAILVHLQTLFADAVLTYRCWIVFAKSKLAIALLVTLWTADFVCTVVRAYFQLNQASHVQLILHIIIVFWACSIALNLYATSLIAYKIVSMQKLESLSTQRVRFVMRVIIESGLMYTATAVMLFISLFTNNLFVSDFLSAINFQTVGIAFNLIIIRVMSDTVDKNAASATQERLTSVQFEMSSGISLHRQDKGPRNRNGDSSV
ncbi:hypothetical protein AX14_008065 [Amanita brunnescens Koide BX004]|nr:hypothetical protein AX14_008065 [Amanita brunnescens Koide BX004]